MMVGESPTLLHGTPEQFEGKGCARLRPILRRGTIRATQAQLPNPRVPMYPFRHLGIEILLARRAPLPIDGVHVSTHTCMPWDIDPWDELNARAWPPTLQAIPR